MPDYNFVDIFKCNIFKNNNVVGKQPNFSNKELKIDVAIPAGTYKVAAWQYPDSGNLSFVLQRDYTVYEDRPADEEKRSANGFG